MRIPLRLAHAETPTKIVHIGGTEEVRRHLENLGMVVGKEVKIKNRLGDNLILDVVGSRVAVSEELARRIMVEEGSGDENVE